MHTLLLVDDVKTTLAVEKSFLESRNFRVFATTSASDALRVAEAIQPDLIILDYEMPEMTGDQVCVRLKDSPITKGIPVLILTSHTEEKIGTICEAAGAVGLLSKSEGRESLLNQVAGILGLPQRRHIRVPCAISVGIQAEDRQIHGIAHNLSASGLYLTVDRPLRVKTLVKLSFVLPGMEKPMKVLAEIVRSEELGGSRRGLGLQFLEADEESLEALSRFVRETI